ncbi:MULTISPECIES: helix-turn-helix transcriptional regulator [unclassified Cellulomonas]|uniref:helix-turn-helix domain-containing protein n=1 Tax=unclassified Cellulomonas TaxID=2620175 RepID=UPI0011C7427B|nr:MULTISPECIES: helix-turn-helix transcriptional regulator [unclassified Cellulomonas]MBW0253154.1 helix-turn-helix transcriptional regulator [Cellulomonas sp. PS-H5]
MTALADAPRAVTDLFGEPLSPRERVVLAELAEDVTLEDIARKLFVSRNTVKTQVRSIYRKIGASTRAEAAAWAEAAGLR